MTPIVLCTVVFLLSALNFTAAQLPVSCSGRCGSEYYRGYMCQCDYNCLEYEECCKDYETQCTTKDSCKGRCGESFKRGRLCSCDSNCLKYNQCCPDYLMHCDAEQPTLTTSDQDSFTLSEGNNQDDLKSLESPTTNDEFTNDLETSPIPNSSSGPQPTTEAPTQETQTLDSTTENVMSVSEAGMTYSDDGSLFNAQPTNGDAPTESTDAKTKGTTEENISNSTQTTSVPQTGSTTPTSALRLETEGRTETQSEETSSPSAEPEITTSPISTHTSITENTQVPSDPSSPIPTLTATAEETTVPPSLSTTPNPPSTTVSSSEPDAETTNTSLLSTITAAKDGTMDSSTPKAPTTTTANPLLDSPKPTSSNRTEPTTKPQDKHESTKPPSSKPQDNQQNHNDQQGYQADDSNDADLCSGRPVGAVTTLSNGTTVVFRGHYFWFLDRNRVPGPARGITQVWGVPSPIDTVFTRCNCQGKTYIFKSGRYWRFENDVLDAGYPRAVNTGFDGLQGHITAALSAPQYNLRGESVYFFKRGGFVQKYSYQSGTSPSCGKKTQYIVYKASKRTARQAVSVLKPAINIRTSWRGFPTTVTAAVSIPSQHEPDGYKYYVFSRSKSYSVRMDSGRPAIATTKDNMLPQNSFFNCPKKV